MRPTLFGFVCGSAVLLATAAAAGDTAPPRHLVVQVRDTPPRGPAAIVHGADGSYSVSTGGGADRDDRGVAAPDNATVVSTTSHIRRVHILEGERVRVDLPAVQSLQFHVPRSTGTGTGAGAGAGASSGASAGPAANAPSSAGNAAAPGTSVSGVVYVEAVSAFAARFAVAGSAVRIELTPLRRGTVAAPYAAGAAGPDSPVAVTGRLGQWIALGDTDLDDPSRSLSATAEPVSPAAVWVRVDVESVGAPK